MRQNVFRNMKGVKKFPCIYAWEVGSRQRKKYRQRPSGCNCLENSQSYCLAWVMWKKRKKERKQRSIKESLDEGARGE